MNKCDLEEVKHVLWQKFLILAEKPHLWNKYYKCQGFYLRRYSSTIQLSFGDEAIFSDYLRNYPDVSPGTHSKFHVMNKLMATIQQGNKKREDDVLCRKLQRKLNPWYKRLYRALMNAY